MPRDQAVQGVLLGIGIAAVIGILHLGWWWLRWRITDRKEARAHRQRLAAQRVILAAVEARRHLARIRDDDGARLRIPGQRC